MSRMKSLVLFLSVVSAALLMVGCNSNNDVDCMPATDGTRCPLGACCAGSCVSPADYERMCVATPPDSSLDSSLDSSADSSVDSSGDSGSSYMLSRAVRTAKEAGNSLLVVEDDNENTLARVDLATGMAAVISGNALSSLVGTGPSFGNIIDVAVVDGGSALVVDTGLSAIMNVDLADGTRAVVSDAATGTGQAFREVHVIGVDLANSRALVGNTPAGSSAGALLAVDLSTGNRTVISDETTGSGPALPRRMKDLVLDLAMNRAFVLGSGQVLAVDLTTGNRTEISPDDGTGPDSPSYLAMALDAGNGRLLLTDTEFDAVRAVDIMTGTRTIVSDATTGSGANLDHPVDIAMDGTRALVLDGVRQNVVAVDLTTGDRSDIGG